MWRRNAILVAAIGLLGLLVCGARADVAPAPPEAAAAQTAAERAEVMLDGAVQALRNMPIDERQAAIARAEKRFHAAAAAERPWLLRIFNMTSWIELPWFLLGVGGQLAFFLRMFVQWIASERQRRSVVPTAFWWLSMGGSVLLVTYAIWRKDIVIIFGQLLGVVIYARNLWFIHRPHAEATRGVGGSPGNVRQGGPEADPPEVVVEPRDLVGAAEGR